MRSTLEPILITRSVVISVCFHLLRFNMTDNDDATVNEDNETEVVQGIPWCPWQNPELQ